MNDVMIGKDLVEKAEVISAVRSYEHNRVRRKDSAVDVEAVREMGEFLKKRNYDKGILIAKRFTDAAKSEMERKNIEAVSKIIKPHFKVERLYLAINSCIKNLCKAKCGHAPKKEADCKGHVDGNYSCDVRLISDNASFHLDHGWTKFLEKDLARLLAIEKALAKA